MAALLADAVLLSPSEAVWEIRLSDLLRAQNIRSPLDHQAARGAIDQPVEWDRREGLNGGIPRRSEACFRSWMWTEERDRARNDATK